MPTKISHHSLSLLRNFQAEVDEIKLQDNLRIVHRKFLKGDTAEYLLTMLSSIPMGITIDISNYLLDYSFEGEVEDPFNEHYDRYAHLQLFNDVIMSLRLINPDTNMVGRTLASNSIDNDPSGLSRWAMDEIIDYQALKTEPYKFHKDNINNLRAIFKKVTTCRNRQFEIALNRFNRQFGRESEIDKLIDVVIAFEALYLKDIQDELKFRLSVRGAHHVGRNTNPENKQRIFDMLKAAYDIRSEVVHGTIKELKDSKSIKCKSQGPPGQSAPLRF